MTHDESVSKNTKSHPAQRHESMLKRSLRALRVGPREYTDAARRKNILRTLFSPEQRKRHNRRSPWHGGRVSCSKQPSPAPLRNDVRTKTVRPNTRIPFFFCVFRNPCLARRRRDVVGSTGRTFLTGSLLRSGRAPPEESTRIGHVDPSDSRRSSSGRFSRRFFFRGGFSDLPTAVPDETSAPKFRLVTVVCPGTRLDRCEKKNSPTSRRRCKSTDRKPYGRKSRV